MPSFEDLPLELRSIILQDWLENTLTRQRHSLRWKYQYPEESEFAHDERISEARPVILCRRNAAAAKWDRFLGAFGKSSRLELCRLLKPRLARWREEGRVVCARVEALREEFWSLPRHRRGRTIWEWRECLKEACILEWLCNVVEMAMHVEKTKLTKFLVHRVGCGRPGGTCQCFSVEISTDVRHRFCDL